MVAADAVRAEARRICRRAAALEAAVATLRSETLALQFGGAAGTLGVTGRDKGLKGREHAAGVELALPGPPWHTHRDRIAEAASASAIGPGTCARSRHISLGDDDTPTSAKPSSPRAKAAGSSTMPHKRILLLRRQRAGGGHHGPNLAATIFAAQVQDHERSAGPGTPNGRRC